MCVHWELCQGCPPSTSTAASRIMGAYSETGSNECVICMCTLDLRSAIFTREGHPFQPSTQLQEEYTKEGAGEDLPNQPDQLDDPGAK